MAPQPHHQHLAFRITEAGIVFHQPGLTVLDHQPGVKHAAIGCAALGHFGNCGLYDLFQRQCGHSIGQDRCGRIGPHAARVGTGIAIADALVILRRADGPHVLSIAQHEERGLFARHEVFDHNLSACCAEGTAEHIGDRRKCLVDGFGHDHALACGQTIGLDHDGCAARGDIGLGRRRIGKARPARRWRTARIANLFGKGFGGLEPRGVARGAENQNACRHQRVCNASGQRSFRADDDEIDRLLDRKAHHRFAIRDIQRRTFRDFVDPGIAGGHDQAVAFRVLQHRPSQRMFAPATTEDQDVQLCRSAC